MSKKVLLIGLGIWMIAVTGFVVQAQNQTTISRALANQQAMQVFEAKASKVGLMCSYYNEHACSKMILRAEKNPELKKTFLQTEASGVSIFPRSWLWFNAGKVNVSGWVNINALASDEKIIAFLTN